MKKQVITEIAVISCVALCAAVWPRNAEVRDLPAEPVITAVYAKIEARPEETPQIFISGDIPAPEAEAVVESEPMKTKITAEKETASVPPASEIASTPSSTPKASAQSSPDPKPGTIAVIDGIKSM